MQCFVRGKLKMKRAIGSFVDKNDFFHRKVKSYFVDKMYFVESKFNCVHLPNITTRWQQCGRNCSRTSSSDWLMSTRHPIKDTVM